MTTVITAILVAAAVAGCAQRQARDLAANLNRITHDYDAARAAKAQAETAYYADQLRILRGALGGSFVVKEQGTIDKGVPIEQSIAYGRIVTSARRDAYLLAEGLGTPGGDAQSGAGLLRFLNQGLQEDREAFVQAQQRQQQLRAELLASLERIDRQETRLEAIRKELKKLAQPHDLKVTAEQLYAIGQAIQKQLAESDGGPK
jgi:uncharacterized membrane protein